MPVFPPRNMSFPQDQWYNHPKLEQIFDEGIDIRLVRADSKVYLLACLDGNWEMIGKMLLGSRDNDIQLLNWGTKSVYSSIEIVEGMEAAAEMCIRDRHHPAGGDL